MKICGIQKSYFVYACSHSKVLLRTKFKDQSSALILLSTDNLTQVFKQFHVLSRLIMHF